MVSTTTIRTVRPKATKKMKVMATTRATVNICVCCFSRRVHKKTTRVVAVTVAIAAISSLVFHESAGKVRVHLPSLPSHHHHHHRTSRPSYLRRRVRRRKDQKVARTHSTMMMIVNATTVEGVGTYVSIPIGSWVLDMKTTTTLFHANVHQTEKGQGKGVTMVVAGDHHLRLE